MTTFKIYNHQIVNGRIPNRILILIPAGTKKLDLSDCRSLTTLAGINFPAGLEELNLAWCGSLTTLAGINFPAGLKKLNLAWCGSLTTLPELNAGLKELNLYNCSGLTNLPELPAGLKVLSLTGCAALKRRWITSLTIPNIPKDIKAFDLSGCTSLTTLPENLPAGLQYLYLNGCSSLTTLPENLPAGLKQLNLSGCSNLTTLPDLPTSIEYLDLTGCNSLSPESVRKLLALEEANRYNPRFRLIWPEHLVRENQAIPSLKESYRAYYANHPIFARIEPSVDHPTNFQTLKLFHRFISENIAERGGIEVIAQAYLVAEEIRKKPELLEIFDKVSENYLTEYVNQPVNGFLEIASLMAIAREDNITGKIAKAKILRAQELIKYNIRSLRDSVCGTVICLGIFNRIFNRQNLQGATVGRGLEVKLGNAIIHEVHKKLFAEKVIQEPWLAISGNISYQGAIRSFLTKKNIKKMTDLAQKALLGENSQQEAIEFLCATKPEFWAKMIFSKAEREALDQSYHEQIQHLRYQIFLIDPNQLFGSYQISKLGQQIKKIHEKKSATLYYQLIQRTQELIKLTKSHQKSDQNPHQNTSPRSLSPRDSQDEEAEHGEAGGVFSWHRPHQPQITQTHQLWQDYPEDLGASQEFSPRTGLDDHANAEAGRDLLSSEVSPTPIELDPTLTSGQTFIRIGLFERSTSRRPIQISGHLDFLDERLPETAFDQHHQSFGNSLRQARTGRESEQLFTTAVAPQNPENSVSADLFFPDQVTDVILDSSSQLLPNPQPVRTDSSSLRDQTAPTFIWSGTC